MSRLKRTLPWGVTAQAWPATTRQRAIAGMHGEGITIMIRRGSRGVANQRHKTSGGDAAASGNHSFNLRKWPGEQSLE